MLEINKVYHGNNIEVMRGFEDNSIDSVVTDPPYGISFMNKKWDYDVPPVELWKEALRVLKPGGHMLVACGTRTQHRMAVRIEDAGFEIRDIVAWVYGSGFPKSLDIEKAINKLDGVRFSEKPASGVGFMKPDSEDWHVTKNQLVQEEESSERAKQYEGFGTALKPSMELWTLARKPIKGTVAENVLKYGTGGLNIDGCRIGTDEKWEGRELPNAKDGVTWGGALNSSSSSHELGRFPANFIHDGSDEVVELFPNSGGGSLSSGSIRKPSDTVYKAGFQQKESQTDGIDNYGDSGSAARFFYTAKASQEERNAGLYGFEEERHADRNIDDGVGGNNPRNRTNIPKKNFHPTVKPIELMRYLVRLITPPNGLCLDMYLGSGTTAVACKLEGFNYIGIEREEDYVAIANARIAECDKDYKTKESMLSAQDVKEVYDIFDFIGDEDVRDK